MNVNNMILKGNIVFSISPKEIKSYSDSYIIIEKGIVAGIYKELPKNTHGFAMIDYGDNLIIPGFTDLHIHAPQFRQSGLGMDLELLDWLWKYTFHQEEQFSNIQYAENVYTNFVDGLARQGTLHACIFATVHKTATGLLFEILSKKGLKAYVGKVSMDQNCPIALTEETETSIRENEDLVVKYKGHPTVKPILTPRFVPTCSRLMLHKLGELALKYNVPVQSHLAENQDEVKWVRELYPEVKSYSEVYNQNGLFGQTPTLMAHCIYLDDQEMELIRKNNVIAVHCPESNLNLTSGMMRIKRMIEKGIKVGLGTDIGGGHSLSMTKVIVRAIQLSKASKLAEHGNEVLTFEEAFYIATKGNGSFFGKTGSFETGYDFDAIIIDDCSIGKYDFNLMERLQRFVYIGDDRNITARFVNGSLIE